MDSLEDTYERMLEDSYRTYKVIQSEVSKANREGRDVAHVIADPGTKRGDIISISQFSEDGSVDEEAEEFKARVLATMPRSALDDTGVVVDCVEALCIVLKPGDIESLDDFAALYGDSEDSEQEALEAEDSDSEPEEPEDANICPCGADIQMCETNQRVFGGHLNE